MSAPTASYQPPPGRVKFSSAPPRSQEGLACVECALVCFQVGALV